MVVSRKSDIYWAKAFTMHMYLQFYKEFTPDLLHDFYADEKLKIDIGNKPNNEIKVIQEGDK